MNKQILTVLLIGFMLCVPNISQAKVEKGDQELSLDGSVTTLDSYSYDGNNVASTTKFGLGVSYGVFLTDAIQLGVSGRGDTNWNGESGYDQMNVSGFCKYHFMTETDIVPYIGGQAGYAYTAYYQPNTPDSESSSLSYGGMLGVKWFVKENISFYTEYNVNVTEHESGSSLVTNQGLFGLAIYF